MANPPLHPAAKTAAASWMGLHGAKFHKNAMSKKTSAPAGGQFVGKAATPPVAGAAPQQAPRPTKLPPVVNPTPKPSQLQGAKAVTRSSRIAAD